MISHRLFISHKVNQGRNHKTMGRSQILGLLAFELLVYTVEQKFISHATQCYVDFISFLSLIKILIYINVLWNYVAKYLEFY